MTGSRLAPAWDVKDSPTLDFYDMKGRIELLLAGLRYTDVSYAESSASTPLSAAHLHPGKAAEVKVNGQTVGLFGELHPLVKERYEVGDAPVIVAEFDLDALATTPTWDHAGLRVPAGVRDIAAIVDDRRRGARSLIGQTGERP
jgi:phenylalanyl-tRNA synthetase beta chain